MKVFKYQLWHFLILMGLLWAVYLVSMNDLSMLMGSFWDVGTRSWLIFALITPILHQFYVVLCWRLELHYSYITNTFGTNGFLFYKIGFAVLILLRPVSIILVAISNTGSLDTNGQVAQVLSFVLLVPSVYLFYSVKKYFGIDRAFGEDHFRPEHYMNQTFIKKGIFRYTSNGMYIYGFLILYIPGLLLLSKAALLAALFNHIYIWVHYYFTELPDIKFIYNSDSHQ